MNKVVSAVTAATLLLAAMIPNQASAVCYGQYCQPKPPKIFHGGGSSGAGAAAAGGFIGFVALLAGYDLLRRTTCSGDFLRLGGPGFSEPMPTTGNVLPPQCRPPTVVRTRG